MEILRYLIISLVSFAVALFIPADGIAQIQGRIPIFSFFSNPDFVVTGRFAIFLIIFLISHVVFPNARRSVKKINENKKLQGRWKIKETKTENGQKIQLVGSVEIKFDSDFDFIFKNGTSKNEKFKSQWQSRKSMIQNSEIFHVVFVVNPSGHGNSWEAFGTFEIINERRIEGQYRCIDDKNISGDMTLER